jgi:hypothetical protein
MNRHTFYHTRGEHVHMNRHTFYRIRGEYVHMNKQTLYRTRGEHVERLSVHVCVFAPSALDRLSVHVYVFASSAVERLSGTYKRSTALEANTYTITPPTMLGLMQKLLIVPTINLTNSTIKANIKKV